MASMFQEAVAFNRPIPNWDVAVVTTMANMFNGATVYDRPMDSWNVASVTTMLSMFQEAIAFNQNIDSWNVRAVTTMDGMFEAAAAFNTPINSWQVVGVTDMDNMFDEAIAFNQPLNNWDIGNVSMRSMFEDATSFNQFLGDWNIEGVTNMQSMLDDTALSLVNYDNTIIAWSEQDLVPSITFGARNLVFCEATNARDFMINNFDWRCIGDTSDCPIPGCAQLTSPENGATDVPVNTNLTWEPVLYALDGYRLTIQSTPGGTILNEEVVTETSYEFPDNFDGGELVSVTITPFNSTGDAVGCDEESFTITTTPATIPDCTTLIETLSGASEVSLSIAIAWNPVSNADTYLLNVGTNPGATDILNNEDVGNVTTFDLEEDLPENSTIYVTIIPRNEEGDAVVCSEESFTTEVIPVPPLCTTLASPLNGASDVLAGAIISWNAVENALGYIVIVGTLPGATDIANNIIVLGETSIDLEEDLPENETIYVTIIPFNDIGDATGCTEESFSTDTVTTPPDCTSLTAPLDNSTNVLIDTNLTWAVAPSATSYQVSVGTTSGGTETVNNEIVTNPEFDFPLNLEGDTEYFVTITPINAIGNAVGCLEESFRTETVPDCTSLTVPLDNSTGVLIDTNLTWTAVTEATSYQVSVGTTSGGTETVNNEIVTNPEFDFSSNLEGNTEYFVTITPINRIGNAVGCLEESFRTETAPDCTTLTAPLDDSIDVLIDTNLTWTAVTEATSYQVSVGTTSGGTETVNNEIVTIPEFDFPLNLLGDTEYFVTITPINRVGNAVGCLEESFRTETAPDCTTLTAPLDDSIDVLIDTNLTWTAVTGATSYQVAVGTTSGGTETVNNEIVTIPEFDFPLNLLGDTEYFVTITPINRIGNAVGCLEESFRTETAPDCTTLTVPLDDSIGVLIDTNLEWTAITGATSYQVTVGTTSGGTETVNNEIVTSPEFDFPSDLEGDTEYFVTITPINRVGNAVGCLEESFRTETVPGCTALTTPLDDSIGVLIDTNLTWTAITGATSYQVAVGTTSGGTETVNNEIVTSPEFDFPSDLEGDTEYFVTITPINRIGSAVGCLEESFRTETVPDCTSLTIPENGEIGVSVFASLGWNIAPRATSYQVSVGTTPGGTDVVNNEEVATNEFGFSSDLLGNTEYFVTITPINRIGSAVGCIEESFTTETVPDCTNITSELIDVALEGAEITWEPIDEALGYTVFIGSEPGVYDIIADEDVGGETSYIVESTLENNATIYVLIVPYNDAGNSVDCLEESLETLTTNQTKFGLSPNGDGINDFWEIDRIEEFPDNEVLIYNRWGNVVFRTRNYDNRSNVFTGVANQLVDLGAGELISGTYFYEIRINGEHDFGQLKGFLVLKR